MVDFGNSRTVSWKALVSFWSCCSDMEKATMGSSYLASRRFRYSGDWVSRRGVIPISIPSNCAFFVNSKIRSSP